MNEKRRRFTGAAVLSLAIAALGACASSAVLVGKARPAIAPEHVKLYLRPPKKYEEVALLEASSKASFAVTDQGKMDAVIQRMKVEAAKLGANGILLQGTGNEYSGSVNTGVGSATVSGKTAFGTGFGTSVGIMQKAGNGIAIFVEEE